MNHRSGGRPFLPRLALVMVILAGLACQVIPTPPALKSTPRLTQTAPAIFPAETLTAAAPGALGPSVPASTAIPGEMPEFPYRPGSAYAEVESTTGAGGPPVSGVTEINLPVDAKQIVNRQVVAGLTLRQQNELFNTGFTIVRTRENDFEAVRRRVAVCFGQPYFLTADSAYHALDLALDRLLPALEKEELHRRLLASASAALKETLGYQPLVEDERLAADVGLAAAYLAVGVHLLDPDAPIDPNLQAVVDAQIAQIDAARGVEDSVLIPGYRDDFRRYQPQGHYAFDPTLSNYWRGRAWFSRAGFDMDSEAGRAALVLTMALRRAAVDPTLLPRAVAALSAAQVWADVYATLRFLHGPGLDYGPAEYAALMDRIYPPGLTLISLADAERWELMKVYARELPETEINVLINGLRAEAGAPRGWRWLPLDLRLDDAILASLEGKRPPALEGMHPLPSGLEVPAALGSAAALQALNADTPRNAAYLEAIEHTRSRFVPPLVDPEQPVEDWSEALWLQAIHSRLQTGSETAVTVEAFRELNSALGAWIDRRRLATGERSASQPQASTRHVQPTTPAAMDLTPAVYYRLARIAFTLAQGLTEHGLTGVYASNSEAGGLHLEIQNIFDLGERLQRLGDIAAAASRGEPLNEDDRALIIDSLIPDAASTPGCLSDFDSHTDSHGLITLQSADGFVQYAGIGGVDRIYALTQINGEVYIAQGGVYSVYEFPEARYGTMDDFGWRQMLSFDLIEPPPWTGELHQPEGSPVDVLLFRIGYRYRVGRTAGRITLRSEPGRAAGVAARLSPGDVFTIIDGPHSMDGDPWWQVSIEGENSSPVVGWLTEDPVRFSLIY